MSVSRGRLADIARRWCPFTYLFSYDDTDERGQLINTTRTFHTSCCEKLWIVVLGLVLIVGVAASTYLLIVEGRDPTPDGFILVPRSQWISQPKCANLSKLSLPVQQILLLPANISDCRNQSDCLNTLKDLQDEHVGKLKAPHFLYNFVIAGDDRIYEGRGWNCTSSYVDNGIELLTIAFLGDFIEQPPTKRQVKRLEAFLKDAIMQNNLSNCYRILVRDSTRFITDVASELELRKEKNIC